MSEAPRDAADDWTPESVQRLRASLGLSQAELAACVGTRQQTISEWETGARPPPDVALPAAPRRGGVRLLQRDPGPARDRRVTAVREISPPYGTPSDPAHDPPHGAPLASHARGGETPFEERALVARWLLGRVPAAALPFPLLRAGRAGRGHGPDAPERPCCCRAA